MASDWVRIVTIRRSNSVTDITTSVSRACLKGLTATLLAMFVMMLAVPRSAAQLETGSVVGIVTDSSGAVYAGAQVVIENILTGSKVALTTNGSGVYDAPVL